MSSNPTAPPPPLPEAQMSVIDTDLSLLLPLTRRGHGPGLIALCPNTTEDPCSIKDGVPSPMIKWAEEGFAVVEIRMQALESRSPQEVLRLSLDALTKCDKCEPKDKIGLVAYAPDGWNAVAPALGDFPSIVAGVVYANASDSENLASASPAIPGLRHLAGAVGARRPERSERLTEYHYDKARDHLFATPFHPGFHYSSESVSYTRNLSFLKKHIGGPYFDLEAIWDEHTLYEFGDRSVEYTMSTMVQEPYVNHVPTVTGGIGRDKLTYFYRHHFIFSNAADSALELISRTVGVDRVVDEFVFKFTHDREIDWLLPQVPPTHKKAEVPFTSVVNIRGDRLYHEHIHWDTGTCLKQLGLMPEYLPFPYPLPEWSGASPSKAVEYRVPVAGRETAEKIRDRNAVPSNEMFEFKVRQV
ncbi:hypothetical protein F4778DRAFT_757716 [Xylariomycetidae sp. FL2044]|nr:hypothetical protein F4778DRAFT_757716 [Xylariomycetidae sp. FL2044]